MLQTYFSFRICDATLEGRFYVWLPVPEWMQSCADPEMHRDTQEAACDHGYGRMQSGEEPDAGGGSEGTALGQIGSTCSFSHSLISKVCSTAFSHISFLQDVWQVVAELFVSADWQCFCWLLSCCPGAAGRACLQVQEKSCNWEMSSSFSLVFSES